jgi:ribosomal protein S18 acetylase RimI-like enzyme
VSSEPSAAPAIRVRPARAEDLPRTAEIHGRSLPNGFFARLGTGFLARYHATFAAGRRAAMLVAVTHDGRIVGFLAGTVDNARHVRSVLRRPPPRLVLSALLALARDPRLGFEFLRTRVGRYLHTFRRALVPRRRTAAATGGTSAPTGTAGARTASRPDPDDPVVGVLTHVAVDDQVRGTGAGRALVDAFLDRARHARVPEVRLVTSRREGAADFYRRLGWSSLGTRRAADGTVVEEFQQHP